jgi:uncharacterized protein YbjT (DUF2867 family)
MNILLFGATGMVGQGVLRECLLDPDVDSILSIVRSPSGQVSEKKVSELVHDNFFDFSAIEHELTGYDACFFSLGVTSAGKAEEQYRHITYDITLAAARTLAKVNPQMTFVYVSGAGTDSTEKGRSMWARVKGETENALLRLPFKGAYMFRPGIIQPLHGITSKTTSYRFFYTLSKPLFPLVKAISPQSLTTTEQVGRAMLLVAKRGYPTPFLESRDINSL